MAFPYLPIFDQGLSGDGLISSSQTEAPVDSACTGTSGTKSLSATNASFAAGDLIFIHQTQGTGAGNREFNIISSYSAGTITTMYNLSNTYNSGAQVLVVKLWRGYKINTSQQLTQKGWNGTVGGITVIVSSGIVDISGTLFIQSTGFRGGQGNNNSNTFAYYGEGHTGPSASIGAATANGNGGGAGRVGSGGPSASGGGNGAVGGGANGGAAVGSADMSTIFLGGGGGGTGMDSPSNNNGHAGSGICIIFAPLIIVTGAITGNGPTSYVNAGGGAGASIWLCGDEVSVGSSLVKAAGGTGGNNPGGNGRIRVEAGSLTGTFDITPSTVLGGFSWLGSIGPRR